MTEEDKNAAAAFIKLHADVRTLVLDVVAQEIRMNPYGSFATELADYIARRMMEQGALRNELHNYRLVYKGSTAPSY